MKSLVSRLSHPRVSRLASLALAMSLVLCAFGATNELDIARQALRDGFLSLAREHAQASACEEARLVVLESWAREGKWADVLNTLASYGNPTNAACGYYRLLAQVKTDDGKAVRAAFLAPLPADPVYARLTARLLAERALARGDPAAAVKIYAGVPGLEIDDRLILAEAKSRLGEQASAQELWRTVLASTNAAARAAVTAAANLGDERALRQAISNDAPAEVLSLARLRLGVILLSRSETFEEGSGLIRKTATESPDAEGAQEAYRELASARLRRGDWTGASAAYRELLEIWPAAASVESVQEGLGWALLKLGRAEDALQTFRQAEACAATDEERAAAAVKTGDALLALGKVAESTEKCREVITRWPKASVAKDLPKIVRLRELELGGRALYREFRFVEAQKAFAEVGAGDASRRGRMAFFEILCLYGQGRDAEAETRARALAKAATDPRLRSDVTYWLARSAYNGARWREAKDLLMDYASSPLTAAADAAAARVWAARASLAANDFEAAIALAKEVVAAEPPSSVVKAEAMIVQGEALLELARFDVAVVVFERAAALPDVSVELRREASLLRADALYAMGADNPTRYEQALAAYRLLAQAEALTDSSRLALAYKTGLALEKLDRRSEAVDQYYTHVILAYRDARQAGRTLDEAARAVFARAAFRLADLCEASGHFQQAQKTLELVAESGVPAAAEASKRVERLRTKGVLP